MYNSASIPEATVTAEAAGSSPVVPAILSKRVARISLKLSRAQKGTFSCLITSCRGKLKWNLPMGKPLRKPATKPRSPHRPTTVGEGIRRFKTRPGQTAQRTETREHQADAAGSRAVSGETNPEGCSDRRMLRSGRVKGKSHRRYRFNFDWFSFSARGCS